MKSMKIPLSPFDMFTSIIPAIVFLISLSFLYGPNGSPFFTNITTLFKNNAVNLLPVSHKGLTVALVTIISITIVFCVGHIIMAAASLLIDRLFVGQGLNYPYVHLFKLPRSNWEKLSNKFYLSFCSFVLFAAALLLWQPHKLLLIILGGYIFFLIVIKIAISDIRSHLNKEEPNRTSWTIPIINKSIDISPPKRPQLRDKGKKAFNILLCLCLYLSGVVSVIRNMISSLFGMKRFQADFINKFKKLFQPRFDINLETNDLDASIFWLTYATLHESRPSTSQSLHFIRILYYFSRNLCMAFLAGFITATAMAIIDGPIINPAIKTYGFTCLLLSFLFFIHYYNIYYNHYTKQTFRAFVAFGVSGFPGRAHEISSNHVA